MGCPIEIESGQVLVRVASQGHLDGEAKGVCGSAEGEEVMEGRKLRNMRR